MLMPFKIISDQITAVGSNVLATEQYFSSDNWTALRTLSRGISPSIENVIKISLNEEGMASFFASSV